MTDLAAAMAERGTAYAIYLSRVVKVWVRSLGNGPKRVRPGGPWVAMPNEHLVNSHCVSSSFMGLCSEAGDDAEAGCVRRPGADRKD